MNVKKDIVLTVMDYLQKARKGLQEGFYKRESE